MERIEKKIKHEITYKGKKRSFYSRWSEWQFTEEERDCFRRVSFKKHKIKKTDIEDFINHIEIYCWDMKRASENLKESEVKLLRADILSDCKKAFRRLEHIWRGRVYLEPFTLPSREVSKEDKEKDTKFLLQVLKKSRGAADSLLDFIKLLKSDSGMQKRSVGRPKADQIGFIKKIAEIYRQHVGRTSAYPYGPFYEVVSIALEAVGLPSKSPGRGIKEALKND